MTKGTGSKRGRRLAGGVILTLAACGGGGGGGGPINPGGNTPAVAGNYNATFAATQATGCQGLVVAPSSTTGVMRITQAGTSVTLHISELADELASNAVGTISESGVFHFQGVVLLDPDPNVANDEAPATGTIDGTLSGSSINLTFNFSLLTCTVVGTITGQRQ